MAGRIVLAIAGLLIAAFALMLAFGMAGGGHGWVTPLFFSPVLFVAYPVALVRLTATGPKWAFVALVIVGLGGLADIALLFATFQEGTQYFWRVMDSFAAIPILWLALWFGWQGIALVCLRRDRAIREDAGFY